MGSPLLTHPFPSVHSCMPKHIHLFQQTSVQRSLCSSCVGVQDGNGGELVETSRGLFCLFPLRLATSWSLPPCVSCIQVDPSPGGLVFMVPSILSALWGREESQRFLHWPRRLQPHSLPSVSSTNSQGSPRAGISEHGIVPAPAHSSMPPVPAWMAFGPESDRGLFFSLTPAVPTNPRGLHSLHAISSRPQVSPLRDFSVRSRGVDCVRLSPL